MWPPAALEFLRDLEDNNDRDWFKANRARYDDHLVAPGRALAESVEHPPPTSSSASARRSTTSAARRPSSAP